MKKTVFGGLLNNFRVQRQRARDEAVAKLWADNGLKSVAHRDGYKMAETEQINKDGTEIIEYRLYKLIDAAVVTVSANIDVKVETGKDKAKEMHHDGARVSKKSD